MPHDTKEFEKLYAAVTASLRTFALAGRAKVQVSNQELQWFEYLIQGFLVEFQNWSSPTHTEIDEYLSMFDRGKASLPLRVAAHAFLHVGFDLPRVIADSLAKFPVPRWRLRALFLRPAPLFREIFFTQAKAGTFGLLGRPLGFVKPMEVLAYWLLSLRSVAWIHAEILADAASHVRRAKEHALAQAVLDTGRIALDSAWIFGIPKLDSSQIFQVTPAPLLLVDARMLATLAALAIGGMALRFRNESIAARIGLMGQHFSAIAPKRLAATESALGENT